MNQLNQFQHKNTSKHTILKEIGVNKTPLGFRRSILNYILIKEKGSNKYVNDCKIQFTLVSMTPSHMFRATKMFS